MKHLLIILATFCYHDSSNNQTLSKVETEPIDTLFTQAKEWIIKDTTIYFDEDVTEVLIHFGDKRNKVTSNYETSERMNTYILERKSDKSSAIEYLPLIVAIISNIVLMAIFFITQKNVAKFKRNEELRKHLSEYITLFKTRDLKDKKLPEDMIRYTSMIRLYLNGDKKKHRKLIEALNEANTLLMENPKASDKQYKKLQDKILIASLQIVNFHFFWTKNQSVEKS